MTEITDRIASHLPVGPFWGIVLFASVAETAAAAGFVCAAGWLQTALGLFLAGFPLAALACLLLASRRHAPHRRTSSAGDDDEAARRFVMVLGCPEGDTDLDGLARRTAAAIAEDADVNPVGSSDSRLPEIVQKALTEACWAGLWHRLQRVIERLAFRDIGLREVLKFMCEYAGVSIAVDWRSLRKVGIEETTSIGMAESQITVWDALQIIINGLNGEEPFEDRISCRIANNMVQISARLK